MMIAGSELRKRLIAGTVGIAYAVVYGFWTLLLTGGGHINFVWAWLFFVVEGFGLYFPLMAVLLFDLRKMFVKVIFGSLIGFNLIISCLVLHGWVTAPGEDGRVSDFQRTVDVNGFSSVLFFGAIHFLPTLVFLILLIRALVGHGSPLDDDSLTEIQLS